MEENNREEENRDENEVLKSEEALKKVEDSAIQENEELDSNKELNQSNSSELPLNYSDQPIDETQAQNNNHFLCKWNWGAFALPMWFGIANRSYLGLLSLLILVPFVGPIFALVWSIIFGLHGEKWALDNRSNTYRDEEEFRKIMQGWHRAGIVAFIVEIVSIVIAIILMIILIAVSMNDVDTNYHQDLFDSYRSYNNF